MALKSFPPLIKGARGIFALSILSVFTCTATAQSQLRSAESVEVKKGVIVKSGVLADSASKIFIEFVGGDRVAFLDKKEIYEGEILPPSIVDAPAKAPRQRMRSILSFELINDSGDEVSIISQYSLLPNKERRRLSLKSENLDGRYGAQFLTRIFDEDEVGIPKLWFYNQSDKKWERIGGILTESAEPDVKVFSSIINKSGVYTLWDENPVPSYNPNVNPEDIDLAEESPFPSVDTTGSTSGYNREEFQPGGSFVGGIVDGVSDFISGEDEIQLGRRSQTTINNQREEGDFQFDAQLDEALVLEDLEETPRVIPALGTVVPTSEPVITTPPQSTIPPVIQEKITPPEQTPQAFQSSAPLLQANSFLNGSTLPKTGTSEPIRIPWIVFGLLTLIGISMYVALQKKS